MGQRAENNTTNIIAGHTSLINKIIRILLINSVRGNNMVRVAALWRMSGDGRRLTHDLRRLKKHLGVIKAMLES